MKLKKSQASLAFLLKFSLKANKFFGCSKIVNVFMLEAPMPPFNANEGFEAEKINV
jgi:hypothetical protein